MLEEFRPWSRGLIYEAPRIPVVSEPDRRRRRRRRAALAGVLGPARPRRPSASPTASAPCRTGRRARFVELGPDGVLTAMAADCLADAADGAGRSLSRRCARPPPRPTDAAHGALAPAARPRRRRRLGRPVRRPRRPPRRPAHVRLPARRVLARPAGGGRGRARRPGWPRPTTRCWAPPSAADSDGSAADRAAVLARHPWLADHAVWAAGAAARHRPSGAGDARRRRGRLRPGRGAHPGAPLVLPEAGRVRLQVSVAAPDGTDGSGRRPVSVHSRPEGDADGQGWSRNAHGTVLPDGDGFGPARSLPPKPAGTGPGCGRRAAPDLGDLGALGVGKAVQGEGHDAGPERVADQRDLLDFPRLSVMSEDACEIGRHALGRLLGPEVAEAVHAHDGHAFARQDLAHCLVEVAPAAVARVDHRHPGAGAGGRELDEVEAREHPCRLDARRGRRRRARPADWRRSRTRSRHALRGEGGEVGASGVREEMRRKPGRSGFPARRSHRREWVSKAPPGIAAPSWRAPAPDRRRRRRRPSRPAPARAPRRRGRRLPRHRPGSEIHIHCCRDRAGRACSDPSISEIT